MTRAPAPASESHVLTLVDGRRLSYRLFGDPDGRPVLNCHGGLVDGDDVAPAHTDAAELGIRLVSPDRPGVGSSDRKPGHGMADWVASDVRALLDHLGVERLAAMGWSAGGQYALAVAHGLGPRVEEVAVVAGCPPLDRRSTFSALNRGDRLLATLSQRASPVARTCFAVVHALARWAPSTLVAAVCRDLPGSEAEAVRAEGRWLARMVARATADTRGAVDEYRALVAPWGFAPGEVAVPVHLTQGTADRFVPPAWGSVLESGIDSASLTLLPGEGHFVALTRRRTVLEALAP